MKKFFQKLVCSLIMFKHKRNIKATVGLGGYPTFRLILQTSEILDGNLLFSCCTEINRIAQLSGGKY